MDLELGHTILIAVYVLLMGATGIGAVLYHKAWREMKRTRIILSVMLLLTALWISAVYFGIAEAARLHNQALYDVMKGPWIKMIPKGLTLLAVTNFITSSVAKDSKDLQKATKKIGGQRK